jgi:hypothetical protein
MLAPTVAGDPDHLALDAGVQVGAEAVVGEEGVQFGQQAHGREPSKAGDAVGRVDSIT